MTIELLTHIDQPLVSPARVTDPHREVFRLGAVQHRWHPDPDFYYRPGGGPRPGSRRTT